MAKIKTTVRNQIKMKNLDKLLATSTSRKNEIRDHAYIDIKENHDGSLAASMKEKLSDVHPPSPEICICRVHEKIRKVNENAYTPMTVAIGPFHRDQEKLKPMEEYKWHCLGALLNRNPEANLEICIKAIRELEEEARKCYAETIDLKSNEFVEMMVVDGCFIVEFFLRLANKSLRDDLFHHTSWMITSIMLDLILIENQLPMFVLKCLVHLTVVPIGEFYPSLADPVLLCLKILLCIGGFEGDNSGAVSEKISRAHLPDLLSGKDILSSKHLLDLFRRCCTPVENPRNCSKSTELVNSIAELHEAGIKVKVRQGNHLLDINFTGGVLEIPFLVINDLTEPLFRNLIAYEQFFCDNNLSYITYYASFMGKLVNSSKDVGLLRRKGIIENMLGNDEEVAHLFNKLCQEVAIDSDFIYSNIVEEVNAYYKKRWHAWRASLRHNYFNSPWRSLSVVAAIVLLLLTVVATIFSMLSFFIHKS